MVFGDTLSPQYAIYETLHMTSKGFGRDVDIEARIPIGASGILVMFMHLINIMLIKRKQNIHNRNTQNFVSATTLSLKTSNLLSLEQVSEPYILAVYVLL
jgi:hypothetical protein